jgi:homoserine dehydrogenase
LVRDKAKPRPIPEALLRTEPFDLLEADVVVEAMGGVEAPLGLVLPALEAGIPLITANKALLAEAWARLKPFAEEGLIYHEASVMAGTPALSFLETLRGSQLLELHGILNGTTLYILQEMEQGRTYEEALREAQRLGYAEADPSLDVKGIDAAHKLTLPGPPPPGPGLPLEPGGGQGD